MAFLGWFDSTQREYLVTGGFLAADEEDEEHLKFASHYHKMGIILGVAAAIGACVWCARRQVGTDEESDAVATGSAGAGTDD